MKQKDKAEWIVLCDDEAGEGRAKSNIKKAIHKQCHFYMGYSLGKNAILNTNQLEKNARYLIMSEDFSTADKVSKILEMGGWIEKTYMTTPDIWGTRLFHHMRDLLTVRNGMVFSLECRIA